MRLDLVLPNEGDFMMEALDAAPRYEAMGWDGLWLTDHVVGVDAYAVYGAKWVEIVVAMTHVAARTSRVRIGSGVLVAPYRDPVLTAKMFASLDHLSGGRIDMGVGTGWAAQEFATLGKADVFEDRGAYTNETLDAMLACWKGGRVGFEGRWFKFHDVGFEPPPLQGARVPLWIGARGLGPATLRRAAKYADYWHPTGVTPEEMRSGGERLDEMAGRAIPRTLRIRPDRDPVRAVDVLASYREAGCVQAACDFGAAGSFADFDRTVAAFFEEAQQLRG